MKKNPLLTTIQFSSLTSLQEDFSLANNALPSSVINSILNKFLTVTPATGKYIFLDNQTPPAPPTGQGIIDKQTLINAGNNVSTD